MGRSSLFFKDGTSGGVETETVADGSWDATGSGFANWGIRVVIDAAQISTSGSTVNVTFVAGTGSDGFSIAGAYIGHAAGAGDAYDFDGNQAQITFDGGSGSVTIAASGTKKSDDISFDLDETKNLIIAVGIANDTGNDEIRDQTSATGFDTYQKSGGNGEESTTDVTGYSKQASRRQAVGQINVFV